MDSSQELLESLLAQRKELQKKLVQIEEEISQIQQSMPKRPQGRPRGTVLLNSMDSLILKSLSENKDGLSFSGIVINLLKNGYKSSASPDDFKKMVKSRISCLKRKDKVLQDNISLVFRLIEN